VAVESHVGPTGPEAGRRSSVPGAMRVAVWLIGGIVLLDVLVVAWLLARTALRERRLAPARRVLGPAGARVSRQPDVGP
jgi:hypothetical protein